VFRGTTVRLSFVNPAAVCVGGFKGGGQRMQLLNETLLRILTGWHGLQARAQEEEGQTLAEYGLIMAVIAVSVVVLAVTVFRNAIVSAFNSAVNCLDGTC
jgi:Flp pilus assembly pilin Flp